jgi:regulator of sirC expression with transglutaminase-like and TPR domain
LAARLVIDEPSKLEGLLRLWGDDVPLDAGAAAIAVDENTALHQATLIKRIDDLAAPLHISTNCSPYEAMARLNHLLFFQLGLTATSWDSPKGYMLNDILDTMKGVPVGLCILTAEISRRAGFPLSIIGFPTHSVVAPIAANPKFYMDPSRNGEVYCEDDLRMELEASLGQTSDPSVWVDAIAPISNRALLERLCATEKYMFLRRDDYEGAIRCCRRILMLAPNRFEELTDLGILLANIGRTDEAIEALEQYLEERPYAPNADAVARQINIIRGH